MSNPSMIKLQAPMVIDTHTCYLTAKSRLLCTYTQLLNYPHLLKYTKATFTNYFSDLVNATFLLSDVHFSENLLCIQWKSKMAPRTIEELNALFMHIDFVPNGSPR